MTKVTSALIVLGNQLFPQASYPAIIPKHIFMAEDYGLCTHYKYHKHKIILFLSAMRKYAQELKNKNYIVDYYDGHHDLFKESYEDKIDDYLAKYSFIKTIHVFEIEDKFFEKRLRDFFEKKNIELITHQSPMFFVSRSDFKDYLENHKRPFMKTFYEANRKKFKKLISDDHKPLGDKWSFDEENRKKLPTKNTPPKLPTIEIDDITQSVIDFTEEHFKEHPGSSENFWLPTTRRESLTWLRDFIDKRLKDFGAYEDAITDQSDFIYHSVLSPMINMGLILPQEVVERVEKAFYQSEDEAPLNSVEGFIRQVLGWREFVRGIYQNYSEQQWERNFWQHERSLNQCWYDGTTGIEILDDTIKKTLKYSYNHHIERLMILSNIMLMCEVHPQNVYAWFMEMYADSSDWVMGPNVFGMGQFSDGGIFATKPYTCGSNYLIKMGPYKKGPWCNVVDGLYWRFIDNNLQFYKSNARTPFAVKNLERMDLNRRHTIFAAAEAFIQRTTSI
jgi:deoxyribodipyrimidine photolyase-related protein